MKSFVCLTLLVVIASVGAASTVGSSSSAVSSDAKQEVEADLKPVHNINQNVDYSRFRKSAGYGGSSGGYGGSSSIPAPPCPKNYLFSCQPNLAPVPCSAPAPSYGSAGGYSAPVPTYVAPVGNNYGVPQGYSGFVPQNFNQFYQY